MENPSEVSKTVKVSIPNELVYEKIPLVVVNSLVKTMGFSVERMEDIKTAVAEAVTNSIQRSYSSKADFQEVVVVFCLKAGSFIIKVKDQGPAPPELSPELSELLGQRPVPRGIDLYLSPGYLADETKTIVSSEGNEIELTFYLEQKAL